MSKRIIAEAFGTFALVLMAAGPAAVGGFDPAAPTGRLVAALSTGFAIASLVYMVGQLSGAHINPAVTIGYLAAGRFPPRAVPTQLGAQVAGALLGGAALAVVAAGAPGGFDLHHLGATGWLFVATPPFAWWSAFLAELVAAFLFVTVFLTIRHEKNPTAADGLAIGLTAAGLLFMIGGVSGGSLNPARSLGPAVFAADRALSQLWLYLTAPTLGAVLAGLFSRVLPLYDSPCGDHDEETVTRVQRNADR